MNRILLPEEFPKLAVFCERNGIPMPNPATSYVGIAERNGEIVYCHMAHLQLHLDNQCRDKGYHGFVDFRKVYLAIEERIPRPARIYTYPTFENGITMAKMCGFEKVEFPTMIKELKCQ